MINLSERQQEVLEELTKTELSWQEKLRLIGQNFKATFSTSFSIEDQLILDFIAREKLPIELFTLDTGRLPDETYTVWQETLEKYQISITPYYPDSEQIEKFVKENGINPFYNSKEMRLKCCEIRKVLPLKRALQGYELWISGLRKEHSTSREDKPFYEFDANLSLLKFYPLLDLSEDEIWQETKKLAIPFNKLYDQGYRSIGCAPCSRAVQVGESIRAGRWWWEDESGKECGLHMVDGKLVRMKREIV